METTTATHQTSFLSVRIPIKTDGANRFRDLTDEVVARLRQAGIRTGVAVITSLHTTASFIINEHEPELLKDLADFLARLAPEDDRYHHNNVPCLPGERPNAHAHCQSLLLQASLTVPISDGKLTLGRYQRIFFVELDCARSREVAVTLLGV